MIDWKIEVYCRECETTHLRVNCVTQSNGRLACAKTGRAVRTYSSRTKSARDKRYRDIL